LWHHVQRKLSLGARLHNAMEIQEATQSNSWSPCFGGVSFSDLLRASELTTCTVNLYKGNCFKIIHIILCMSLFPDFWGQLHTQLFSSLERISTTLLLRIHADHNQEKTHGRKGTWISPSLLYWGTMVKERSI
jgi:hypothetical protein